MKEKLQSIKEQALSKIAEKYPDIVNNLLFLSK